MRSSRRGRDGKWKGEERKGQIESGIREQKGSERKQKLQVRSRSKTRSEINVIADLKGGLVGVEEVRHIREGARTNERVDRADSLHLRKQRRRGC